MCMFDPGDYHTEWSRSESRRARKEHRCGECGRAIQRGERYRIAAGKTEGDIWGAKVCVHCDVAAAWLIENCNGYMYSAVLEDFGEHAEANLPMLRIVVGARRRWKSFADSARLLPVPVYPPNMS